MPDTKITPCCYVVLGKAAILQTAKKLLHLWNRKVCNIRAAPCIYTEPDESIRCPVIPFIFNIQCRGLPFTPWSSSGLFFFFTFSHQTPLNAGYLFSPCTPHAHRPSRRFVIYYFSFSQSFVHEIMRFTFM
jgi:hypothetical protein